MATAYKRPGSNKLEFDIEKLNKCTLCSFASHSNNQFQGHLMKQHGIKLKSFETEGQFANNYNINGTYQGKTKEAFPKCDRCYKVFKDEPDFKSHVEKCQIGLLQCCPQCDASFENLIDLHKHLPNCGKNKNIFCQLCSFKSFAADHMIQHYVFKHNLICKFVDEPDFSQALNSAPYILERPLEVKTLHNIDELGAVQSESKADISVRSIVDPRRLWICPICQKEFAKQRYLNKHRKDCV